MREQTGWFDTPIKFVRDKFFVHAGPKHIKMFTMGWEKDDNLTLTLQVFDAPPEAPRIRFNPWRMSHDIELFLKWFSTYGLRHARR